MQSVYVLLALLALANAIVFPLAFGFPGGAAPLPEGIQSLFPYLTIAAINAVALVLLRKKSIDAAIGFRYILFLAALTRIAYLIVHSLSGATVVDLDTELFFDYGREFAAGRYPSMEYPQGALLLFTLGYRLALGDLATFRIIFPLLMLPFDLIILASLHWLGKRYSNEGTAGSLQLLYAISPFTLVLWYGKYDMAPAALLACGVVLFLARRWSLSAAALAIGFLLKWIPGIALGFFVAYLLRAREYRSALKYAAIASITILLPLIVFWQISPTKVIYPYAFQGARLMLGTSMLYVPIYFFEPTARLDAGDSPWTLVHSGVLNTGAATWILLLGEGIALVTLALRRANDRRTAALAGLGVALFILLNRIYSPQYIIFLFVVYAVAMIALAPKSRLTWLVVPTQLTLMLLNYLVWPLWAVEWFWYSMLFFALNAAVVVWIAVQGWRVEATDV